MSMINLMITILTRFLLSFYRAKLSVARYCHGMLSVCLSVRPSVRL